VGSGIRVRIPSQKKLEFLDQEIGAPDEIVGIRLVFGSDLLGFPRRTARARGSASGESAIGVAFLFHGFSPV